MKMMTRKTVQGGRESSARSNSICATINESSARDFCEFSQMRVHWWQSSAETVLCATSSRQRNAVKRAWRQSEGQQGSASKPWKSLNYLHCARSQARNICGITWNRAQQCGTLRSRKASPGHFGVRLFRTRRKYSKQYGCKRGRRGDTRIRGGKEAVSLQEP